MYGARRVLLSLAGLIAAGCAGGASDGGGDRAESPSPSLPPDVLTAPFQRKQAIVCNRVEIELLPEFNLDLTTPARNPFHRHERKPGPQVEYRFVNESG